MTKSGCCPLRSASCAAAVCSPKSSLRHSKWVHGVICSSLLRRVCTFEVPTSASVATAWRLREESVTWSKSISRILAHPERASAAVACEPTPPQPTTITKAFRSFDRPSSVRKTLFLASCSRMRSVDISVSCEYPNKHIRHTVVIVALSCSCSQRCTPLVFFAWGEDGRCSAVFGQLQISAMSCGGCPGVARLTHSLRMMCIIDIWYGSLQFRDSAHAPGLLKSENGACNYRTRYHCGCDELCIARLGRLGDPRRHGMNDKLTKGNARSISTKSSSYERAIWVTLTWRLCGFMARMQW